MAEASPNPLLVELFLSNGRVHGITHEVHDRIRLVDVLTDGNRAFRMDSAKVLLGATTNVREFGSLNVEKRSIIAAIPHETQAQLRQRSMQTTTVGKSQTRSLRVTLLIPPFVAEGSLHVPQGVGNIGGASNGRREDLSRLYLRHGREASPARRHRGAGAHPPGKQRPHRRHQRRRASRSANAAARIGLRLTKHWQVLYRIPSPFTERNASLGC